VLPSPQYVTQTIPMIRHAHVLGGIAYQ
jgi:hypothetical protein